MDDTANFQPKIYKDGDTEIYDYTGVPQDSIKLSDDDDDLIRPSWMPEIDRDFLLDYQFMPPAIKGGDNMWYVLTRVTRPTDEAYEDNNVPRWKNDDQEVELTPDDWKDNHQVWMKAYNERQDWKNWKEKYLIHADRICKMESGTLTAMVDWYRKKAQQLWMLDGDERTSAIKTSSLPRGQRSMKANRYNAMNKIYDTIPMLKYERESAVVGAKRRNVRARNMVFEQYNDLLDTIKTKSNDFECQQTEDENAYNKGEETSYGDANLSDTLLADYGVKIKKQNGTDITPTETDAIRQILDAVWQGYYGNLSQAAREYALKISYADNVNMHARKASGLFYDAYHAIGVSFAKNEQNTINMTQSMMTLAHESAHWLDCMKGKDGHYRHLSDKDGSKENTIAKKFRKRFTDRDKLKGYWTRTCECFARAVEEDFALTLAERTNNPSIAEEIYSQRGYCPKIWFDDIRPLVHEVIRENQKMFTAKVKNVKPQLKQQTNLTQEEHEYVHSKEFKERFGDWEKAQRIEKLKRSEPIIGKNRIILGGKDITDKVNVLRNGYSKENLKQLQHIAFQLGTEIIKKYRKEQQLDNFASLLFTNSSSKEIANLKAATITEISHHNIFQVGHIEAIQSIPDIINNSIYIGTEENEDNRNPQLKEFHYYALGIKLNREDYTAKSVFALTRNGTLYYDQSLSTIEKGKLVDIIIGKEQPEASSPRKKTEIASGVLILEQLTR